MKAVQDQCNDCERKVRKLSHPILHFETSITSKRSFLYSVTLFNTLAHNTVCDMYVRKNLLSQVSLCDTLKFNELSKGKEVSEADRKLTKICQKSPKEEPYIISENRQNVIIDY